MKREIKFRAWDKEIKTYSEGKIIKEGVMIYFHLDWSAYFDDDKSFVFHAFKNGSPIMQFTGFKDKNGKEIYEGDILSLLNSKWKPPKNRIEVHWDEGTTGWAPFTERFTMMYDGSGELPEDCEIIGNIYENPDLLEAK